MATNLLRSTVHRLLLILFFNPSANAESVDLHTILSEVSANSPTIVKSKAFYDEMSWKKVETFQGFLPSLTGAVNYVTNKRYMLFDANLGPNAVTIAQIIPTTLYSLTATLPLFDGFASTHRYLAGKKIELSAKHDYEWTQFQISRQVTLQFYKTLAAEALKTVAEQNLKTLQDHLKDVQALKKAGVSTTYDVLRVDVQISEAQSEIINTIDNYELAKAKLGEVLGKDSELRELSGKLPVINTVTSEQINSLAFKDRKDLMALEEKVASLQDLNSAAGRHWVPKISAYGQYQYYNNKNDSFTDDNAFREAYQVGLNLTWNIFDGMGSAARSHQASSQALQLEKTLQITKLKTAQELEFWKRKFKYFSTVYRSKLADIGKSQEAIRYAREGRRAGTRPNSELLDTELDLFRSKAGLVNAQIGTVEALINLELASGQQLYDFN